MAQPLLSYDLWVRASLGRECMESSSYRIPASALIWRLGGGQIMSSPLRRRRASGDVYEVVEAKPHSYFLALYS